MRICLGADNKEPDRGRWKGDPIALSDEAFSLTKEKQCAALDFMEEAPGDLRDLLAPVWQHSFSQWLIYDAGCEANIRGTPLAEILASQQMKDDAKAIIAFADGGGFEKAKKAEKWTWKLLDKLPAAGTSEWGDDSSPMVLAAREERADGVAAYQEENYNKAFWHFNQGIRLLARLPEPLTLVQKKLGGDIFKNIAAAALKLDMARIALNSADAAIALFPEDQKAWFRKACALQVLDRDEEATTAFMYAGYAEEEKELGPVVEPPPESSTITAAMQESIEKLVFCQCGIDAMDAVDLMTLLQADVDVTLPAEMIYMCPTVGEAATYICTKGNFDEKTIITNIYRAMCKVTNRDPLQVKHSGKPISEEKALGSLLTLLEAYEAPSYLKKVAEIAKKNEYQLRPFLFGLRRHSLEAQIQTLEIRGFPTTYEGMRKLDCAFLSCAKQSKQVKELLLTVQKARVGGKGPKGMWERAEYESETSKPKKDSAKK